MNFGQTAKAIRAELKASPRLRWGLWAIAGILWLYGALALRDEIQRQTVAYRATSGKIARIQATDSRTVWLARAANARSVLLNLESGLWRESTIGLAQATFHDWLSQLVQQADVARPQLIVAAQDEQTAGRNGAAGSGGGTPVAAGLWKVSARLSFDFYPQSFYPLLTRLTNQKRKVIVESLAIRGAPTPRAELVLVAYFQKPAAAASAELTPPQGQQ